MRSRLTWLAFFVVALLVPNHISLSAEQESVCGVVNDNGDGVSPLDVNQDGLVTAIDALILINAVNRGDEGVSARDVLAVVNYVNWSSQFLVDEI